jgi:hypothetical protein
MCLQGATASGLLVVACGCCCGLAPLPLQIAAPVRVELGLGEVAYTAQS